MIRFSRSSVARLLPSAWSGTTCCTTRSQKVRPHTAAGWSTRLAGGGSLSRWASSSSCTVAGTRGAKCSPQPRLAGARLARDVQEGAAAIRRQSQLILKLSQLTRSSNEGRRGAIEVRVTAAQDAIRLLRLSLPFENEGRNLLEIEGAPGQTPGRLGNQDAVVRRGRLRPLRGGRR